jgi:hypothetical protein
MTPEQQQLEQAIANVNEVVGDVQCNRDVGNILYADWQLIVETAWKGAQPETPAEGDGAT